MEEKKISEKESLELISQMIQSTKEQPIEKGCGNMFLLTGYFTTILGVVVYTLVHFTSNPWWNFGWLSMLLLWVIGVYLGKKNKPKVITYTDAVMVKVAQGINIVIISASLATLVIVSTYAILRLSDIPVAVKINSTVMMPIALLLLGAGLTITGTIVKWKTITYLPLIGVVIAVYMLMSTDYQTYSLYFGLAFIPMMIIPGHLLNKIARKQC